MTDPFTEADELNEAVALNESLVVDELVALMASGLTQVEASRAMWSPGSPIGDALALEFAGRDARRRVRAGILARVPWLRLPGGAS